MSDLDPLLREAMASVKRPIDTRPSISDVHRRARRHGRRRMTATAGAVACTGVATAALIIRRDATEPTTGSQPASDEQVVVETPFPTTTFALFGTTTSVYGLSDLTIRSSTVWDALWNARFDPSGAALVIEPADQAAADVMPTPEQFGCTSDECRAMFTYVVWHEIGKMLGVGDVATLKEVNPSIDFSQPPREGDVLHACCAFTTDTTVYVTMPSTTTTTIMFESTPTPTTTAVGQIDSTTTPG